jgi:hypothetical protein
MTWMNDHRLRHTPVSFFPGGGLIAPAVENSGDQDFHVVSVVVVTGNLVLVETIAVTADDE